MNYLTFLIQWYNWPYLAALLLFAASLARPAALGRLGSWLGGLMGFRRVSGFAVLRVFVVTLGIVGLTVNGALHDYWPAAQERGSVPGLLVTLLLAGLVTRSVGRIFEQHFPEIRAISWGSSDLSGRRGRVVSRVVSVDYRAGRAQVMGEEDTLHIVLCKTRGNEIPYGVEVVLGEYDEKDGRYYVEALGSENAPGNGLEAD